MHCPIPYIQVTLVGPCGHLVFVVVHVSGRALLWPLEYARVPCSAVLEWEPTWKTAPVLLVARGSSCHTPIGFEQSYNDHIFNC